MSEPAEQTALYRYLAADGSPLYIGITDHLEDRQKAHAQSPWALEATSFTVEWFETDAEAAAAETVAIKAERPVHNDTDNFDVVPDTMANWPRITTTRPTRALALAALIQAEIDSGRWSADHKIPSVTALAEAVGLAPGTVRSAIDHLQRSGSVYRYKSFGSFVSSGLKRDPWHHRPRRPHA